MTTQLYSSTHLEYILFIKSTPTTFYFSILDLHIDFLGLPW